MAEKKTFSKRKLFILQVQEAKPYGNKTPQKTLLPLTAKDLSLEPGSQLMDKPLRFVTFSTSIQEFVKEQSKAPNPIILVDYEEQTREGSEYGPDRAIVQAYKADGSPVSSQQQGRGQGGGFGRSPESIKLEYSLKAQIENQERISIEGQTAIAQVGTWLSSPEGLGKVLARDRADQIAAKYWKAVEKALDAYLAATPLKIATPPPATTPSTPTSSHPAGQQAAVKPPAVSNNQPPPSWPALKNVGDFLARAAIHKVMKSDIVTILSLNSVNEIKDLDGAWLKVATAKNLSPIEELWKDK